MFESIKNYCQERVNEFDQIPAERKKKLQNISRNIAGKKDKADLIFVCTHNSRRSHFGQIWGAVATDYFSVNKVTTYSAGTEATAFHSNAIAALERIGFVVEGDDEKKNPNYTVLFGDELSTQCFSKTIDDQTLPKNDFAAIMTCGDAEANCPFLPGAEIRIATAYEDPKVSDGTPEMEKVYDERCKQIAREVLYMMEKSF